MSLNTIVTHIGDAKADTASRFEDRFVIPKKFQISEYKGSFSKERSMSNRNPIRYESDIIEYIVVDPFTVNFVCPIPFTPEEDGNMVIGELYIVAGDNTDAQDFLLSLSQPSVGVQIVKTPGSIVLLNAVVNTPGIPILSTYDFKNVVHSGNACTVQKLNQILKAGQGITTSITVEGKLRIDANFDYLEGN